ncbi:unnamed protein product [Rhizophagus irregularis]|nr:unnamed protein product [Rhizophagus irregularis]
MIPLSQIKIPRSHKNKIFLSTLRPPFKNPVCQHYNLNLIKKIKKINLNYLIIDVVLLQTHSLLWSHESTKSREKFFKRN